MVHLYCIKCELPLCFFFFRIYDTLHRNTYVIITMWFIVIILYLLSSSSSKMSATGKNYSCDTLKKFVFPEENGVTKDCNFTINSSDMKNFVHNIFISDFRLNIWTLNLIFDKNVPLKQTTCAFRPLQWVWTFPGEYGALERLSWPASYKMWSLGILNVDPKSKGYVRLTINGNCSVTLGQPETIQRIGLALIKMTNNSDLIEKRSEIEYSYFCYTEQLWVEKKWLYHLCLHVICPLNALGMKCCRTVYQYETQKKRVMCSPKIMSFGDIWWQYPFIIGIVMFAFFPIILLKTVSTFSSGKDEKESKYGSIQNENQEGSIPKEWLLSNPISVWNLIKRVMINLGCGHSRISSKIIKLTLVFLSLSVLAVEIFQSYNSEYEFVVQSVRQGIPMNFASVLAGYKESREKFLYYFGGPYIALIVYVFSLSLLLCIPKRFSDIIDNGIPDNADLAVTLLKLDLKTKGTLGGIYDLHKQREYKRFYSLLKSHLFLLINPATWVLGYKLQSQRFKGLLNISRRKSLLVYITSLTLIPFYLVLCTMEWCIIIVYFVLPVFSFFFVIISGFWKTLTNYWSSGIGRAIIFPILAFIMFYNIYIFSVIFLESFIYMSRIFIFTMTGFIAFPNKSYVYLVLTLTITMYIAETIHSVRSVYMDYFVRIFSICKDISDKCQFPKVHLFSKYGDSSVISREVFYYVINRLRPIRIEVCFSLAKVLLIMCVLYVAVSMIVSFDSFDKMESVTQVVTVLFICLVPKLCKKLCYTENKLKLMKDNAIIKGLVEDFCRQRLHSGKNRKSDKVLIQSDEISSLISPVEQMDDDSSDELLFESM